MFSHKDAVTGHFLPKTLQKISIHIFVGKVMVSGLVYDLFLGCRLGHVFRIRT